jgi:Putative esterase
MFIGSWLNKHRTLALTLFFLVLSSAWVWEQLKRPWGTQAVQFKPAAQECFQEGALRYCINRAAGGVNGDVLYHLHARNLEAEVWNDTTYFTAMLQASWQNANILPPTVVSLSFGPVWLLTPKGAAEQSGLLDEMILAIDAIEARIGKPQRRLLLGESMGGLNSLILGFSHPHKFSKVAALCPTVYTDSPFAPLGEIRDAIKRTGAEPRIALGVWQLAQRYLSSVEEWRRVSPLELIESAPLKAARPDLYLSAGLYDRYGLYEGTNTLARRAAQVGLPIEWHPLYGGHCAIDVTSLARFLVR